MNFIEWKHLCEGERYLRLEEFLDRHSGHEIFVIEEAIHTWPSDAEELRQLCGKNARVEYLGEESPHWSGVDGLFYVITPLTKKGSKKRPEPIHVVVYPN